MGDGPVFWLREEQVARIRPLFPKEQGVKRVDDRKALSVILIRDSEQSASGGCPGGRWPPHPPLQPLPPLVGQGCF